ncbi:MAG: gliding motility protein GldN [Bacteroidetes bacterium]|nr:gliding motility protein GldN [Bacteroidota bacterium]
MMKSKNVVFASVLFFSQFICAQINILNADNPSEIGALSEAQKKQLSENKYIEYPYVDDKDIMWSKIVYEEIDLSEKFNHPLFFPSDKLYTHERKSLWYTIRQAIINKKIENVYAENNPNFSERIGYERVLEIIQNKDWDLVIASKDISSYLIKGIWYVDKRYGQLSYRLLGIKPISKIDIGVEVDILENGSQRSSDDSARTPLFWLWYKDLRPILHKQLVFDDKNNASRITFDQLLTSRRFTSRIIGVDNVFDDRLLSEMPGLKDDPFMQLIESERLKNVIRDFEQDLWAN